MRIWTSTTSLEWNILLVAVCTLYRVAYFTRATITLPPHNIFWCVVPWLTGRTPLNRWFIEDYPDNHSSVNFVPVTPYKNILTNTLLYGCGCGSRTHYHKVMSLVWLFRFTLPLLFVCTRRNKCTTLQRTVLFCESVSINQLSHISTLTSSCFSHHNVTFVDWSRVKGLAPKPSSGRRPSTINIHPHRNWCCW